MCVLQLQLAAASGRLADLLLACARLARCETADFGPHAQAAASALGCALRPRDTTTATGTASASDSRIVTPTAATASSSSTSPGCATVSDILAALADRLSVRTAATPVLGWGKVTRHGLAVQGPAAATGDVSYLELTRLAPRAVVVRHDTRGFLAIDARGQLVHGGGHRGGDSSSNTAALDAAAEAGTAASQPVPFENVRSLIFTHVDAHSHFAACTQDGALYTWGDNSRGCLGVPTPSSAPAPEPLLVRFFHTPDEAGSSGGSAAATTAGRERVVHVAVGSSYTAAVTATGRLYTWGKSAYGRLGHGDRRDLAAPTLVEALSGLKVVAVSCSTVSDAHTVVLSADGKVYTFGDQDDGKLGRDGEQDVPLVAELPEAAASVALAGPNMTLVLGASGVLYTCGSNAVGLVRGTPSSANKTTLTCLELPATEPFIDVAIGGHRAAALTATGEVWTWPGMKCVIPSISRPLNSLAVATDAVVVWHTASPKPSRPNLAMAGVADAPSTITIASGATHLTAAGVPAELAPLLELLLRAGTASPPDPLAACPGPVLRLLDAHLEAAGLDQGGSTSDSDTRGNGSSNSDTEGGASEAHATTTAPADGTDASASPAVSAHKARALLLQWARAAQPDVTGAAWGVIMRAPAALGFSRAELEETFQLMSHCLAYGDAALADAARDTIRHHWGKAIPNSIERVKYIAALLQNASSAAESAVGAGGAVGAVIGADDATGPVANATKEQDAVPDAGAAQKTRPMPQGQSSAASARHSHTMASLLMQSFTYSDLRRELLQGETAPAEVEAAVLSLTEALLRQMESGSHTGASLTQANDVLLKVLWAVVELLHPPPEAPATTETAPAPLAADAADRAPTAVPPATSSNSDEPAVAAAAPTDAAASETATEAGGAEANTTSTDRPAATVDHASRTAAFSSLIIRVGDLLCEKATQSAQAALQPNADLRVGVMVPFTGWAAALQRTAVVLQGGRGPSEALGRLVCIV